MGIVLWLAVVATAMRLLWMWGSRARQVAVAEQRAAQKVDVEQDRPGGLPSEAIEVASAATIEPIVERNPCSACGGVMHVEQHVVEEHAGARRRRVDATCGSCSWRATTWFRVRVSLPN